MEVPGDIPTLPWTMMFDAPIVTAEEPVYAYDAQLTDTGMGGDDTAKENESDGATY